MHNLNFNINFFFVNTGCPKKNVPFFIYFLKKVQSFSDTLYNLYFSNFATIDTKFRLTTKTQHNKIVVCSTYYCHKTA